MKTWTNDFTKAAITVHEFHPGTNVHTEELKNNYNGQKWYIQYCEE
jgi:hypothetical protein